MSATGENECVIENMVRGDVIIIKYKTVNGIHYYRRWNETQGVWVDPYWIPIN
jgi:hypothetical protein